MKKVLIILLLMIFAGCEYEVPLSQNPSAPANPALTGKWTGEGEKPATMEVSISNLNYSVIYKNHGYTSFFEGFEVEADGFRLVQLKLLNPDEKEPQKQYIFLKYSLTPDGLEIYLIDPKVVSTKCQSSEELLKDLTLHRDNPFLFANPQKFIRSTQ